MSSSKSFRANDGSLTVASESDRLLKPQRAGKMSLEDSFQAMADDPKATAEARTWAASGVADGLKND